MNEKIILQLGYVPDIAVFTSAVEMVVDTNVFMPSMFTVLFEDSIDPLLGLCPLIDNAAKYKIGDPVLISVISEDLSMPGIPKTNLLIQGELTSIEPIFHKNGRVQLRIRGYDRAHRLTRGKRSRTFGDGNPIVPTLTDMQIVQKIAMETGLTAMVDPSELAGVMYHYVMQCNQNDWDFLWSRAQMLGYQVYVENMTLFFTPAGRPRSLLPATPLQYGKNLIRFEPRLVSMGQVTKTQAIGWNPKMKRAMTGMARKLMPMNPIGELRNGPVTITSSFQSQAEDVVIHPGAQTVPVARVLAKARFDNHDSQFIRASGEIIGCDPNLKAGMTVTVSGVGMRFSGMYYLTQVKHIWREGNYSMTFEVTGRNPYTIRHLITGNDAPANRIDGVVVGVVTNTKDPEMLGRVRVKFPWLPPNMGAELESNWARLALPGGGSAKGVLFIPEVDDEVLVAFEHGNIDYPYIVGVLWNTRDKPPTGTGPIVDPSGKVNQRVVTSRTGHTIILDDTQGKEQIIIQDKTKNNSIVIDSVKNSMTIKAQGDLIIEAGGKLSISSTGDLTVDSKAKGVINAATSIAIEGKQSATMKAGQQTVDLQPSGAALKGMKVDIQASTQANIQGNAMVQIQGGIVKIN